MICFLYVGEFTVTLDLRSVQVESEGQSASGEFSVETEDIFRT